MNCITSYFNKYECCVCYRKNNPFRFFVSCSLCHKEICRSCLNRLIHYECPCCRHTYIDENDNESFTILINHYKEQLIEEYIKSRYDITLILERPFIFRKVQYLLLLKQGEIYLID